MKWLKHIPASAFALFFLILSLTGCKKDSNQNSSQQASLVDQSNVLAERTFNDLGSLTDNALALSPGMMKERLTFKQSEKTCMTISLNGSSVPNVLTIDFGSNNCLCTDGLYRRGKIIVSFVPGVGDSLTTLSTVLDNYFVSDNQVTGTRTVTYKGHNAAGHLNWNVDVNGSIITGNDAGTITFQSSHNVEMTAGQDTPLNFQDNVYSITGSAGGTAVNGQMFSTVITTPLIYKTSCSNFVSGVIDVSPSGELDRILDYGTGNCDMLATVTVNGVIIKIDLP